MKTPAGFLWNRPVPSEWSRALATIAPQSELVPWLQLAWLSGDPWGPVQRWAVYEMVPLRVWWGIIQAHRQRGAKDEEIWEYAILQALQGPHPRDLGYYDEILQKFVTTADCTRLEWELFREYKAVPKLFWIIQGQFGGHQWMYTQEQEKCLKLLGLPHEAPTPGSLPYADFDNRVVQLIARHMELKEIHRKRPGKDSPEMIAARKKFVALLEDQMKDCLAGEKLSLDDVPRTEIDPTAAIERRIDRWVETGSLRPQPES